MIHWRSAKAKEKLKKYGIAPPVKNAVSADDLFAEPPADPQNIIPMTEHIVGVTASHADNCA